MHRTWGRTARVLALGAGAAAVAVTAAGPAQADPAADSFISSLTSAGITQVDPANAVTVGRDVCPMLADGGQSMADVASSVADKTDLSIGPAKLFTGIAIGAFCPAAISKVATGDSPLPLSILGF